MPRQSGRAEKSVPSNGGLDHIRSALNGDLSEHVAQSTLHSVGLCCQSLPSLCAVGAESGTKLTVRMFNAVQVLTRQPQIQLTRILNEVGTRVAFTTWCPWLGTALRVVAVEAVVEESAWACED